MRLRGWRGAHQCPPARRCAGRPSPGRGGRGDAGCARPAADEGVHGTPGWPSISTLQVLQAPRGTRRPRRGGRGASPPASRRTAGSCPRSRGVRIVLGPPSSAIARVRVRTWDSGAFTVCLPAFVAARKGSGPDARRASVPAAGITVGVAEGCRMAAISAARASVAGWAMASLGAVAAPAGAAPCARRRGARSQGRQGLAGVGPAARCA